MSQIKICGLTSMEDVKIINDVKPEYIGCVMYFPKSKRNVDDKMATRIVDEINDKIKKVAVVVSPKEEQVLNIKKCGFDYIQIHGEVSKKIIDNSLLPVIRAVNVGSEGLDDEFFLKFKVLLENDNIYGVLFDAGVPGSGKTFDWNMLKTIIPMIKRTDKKLFLAGGLNSDNIIDAIKTINPDVVDVSSGVEYLEKDDRKGKDEKRVIQFVENARKTIMV